MHQQVNPARKRALRRAAKVLIVSSVTFAFISYWRTAAVVLCDLSSTAYYIGAIVENAIGRAAPWFILAVMLFSYAMRSVYIGASALYVRGGVYRVVKEAMGGFLAKLSVSALLFDYVLTGPISAVAAGQYIVGLVIDFMYPGGAPMDEERAEGDPGLVFGDHRLRHHLLLLLAEPGAAFRNRATRP